MMSPNMMSSGMTHPDEWSGTSTPTKERKSLESGRSESLMGVVASSGTSMVNGTASGAGSISGPTDSPSKNEVRDTAEEEVNLEVSQTEIDVDQCDRTALIIVAVSPQCHLAILGAQGDAAEPRQGALCHPPVHTSRAETAECQAAKLIRRRVLIMSQSRNSMHILHFVPDPRRVLVFRPDSGRHSA